MVGVVDVVEIVGDVVKRGGAAVVPLRCMGGAQGQSHCRGTIEVRVFSQQGIRFVVLGICGTGVICGENFVGFCVGDGYLT